MRYIWKMKASPEHFEDKCFNLDRQNTTFSNIFQKNLHKCKISVRRKYAKISQIKKKKNSKIPIR